MVADENIAKIFLNLNLKMNIYFTFEEIYAFLFLASGEKQVFEAVSGCH